MKFVWLSRFCLLLPLLMAAASCGAMRLPFPSKKSKTAAANPAKAAASGLPKPDEQTGRIQLGAMEISPTGEPSAGSEAVAVSAGASPSADSLPALMPPPEAAAWEQLGQMEGMTTQIEVARREGKLLLLFFQNTKLSGGGAQVRDAVLNHPSVLGWKQSRLSIIDLDYGAQDGGAQDGNLKFRDSTAAKTLLERYKIRGYPALVLVLPDGTPLVELKGWRPQKRDRFLTELAGGMKQADQKISARRQQLEAAGYREWHSAEGKAFFGKVTGQEGGQVILQNEWGSSFQVARERFSEADQSLLR